MIKTAFPCLQSCHQRASTHDIKLATDVMDNMIIWRSLPPSTKCDSSRKRKLQHLCLDKAYNSKAAKQSIIKRGYVPHTPYKRSRGQKIEAMCQKKHPSAKNRRWVVERTNSWYNRFRKLFRRYEKKVGNYLGLVQLSCSIIIYRKIILG
jgi:transposase